MPAQIERKDNQVGAHVSGYEDRSARNDGGRPTAPDPFSFPKQARARDRPIGEQTSFI
jgi:hypothetical protein